jgi:hemolysin III
MSTRLAVPPSTVRWRQLAELGLRRRVRDAFSGVSHLIGAMLAVVGTGVLLNACAGDPMRQVVCLVYGLSMTLLLGASGIYHLYNGGDARTFDLLNRADHAAIFLLIAGTYTPLVALVIPQPKSLVLLAVIWGIAVLGVASKLMLGAGTGAKRWRTLAPYLLMGWLAVFILADMVRLLPVGALLWLLGGGLFYTVGGVIYGRKWPDPKPGVFGFHEIWHLFVLAGAACHFVMTLRYVVPFAP